MKTSSEQRNLTALNKRENISNNMVYKACAGVANNGVRLPEEEGLSLEEKVLLDVRRCLFKLEIQEAQVLIDRLTPSTPFLKGDHQFLQAQIFHRKGDQTAASDMMIKASLFYREAGEFHRELRAMVNGKICVSTLESCLYGELNSLEQEARRLEFYDIAANICRTRAIEFLIAGRLKESHAQALEASNLYLLDGYPDDRAVTIMIGAIALFQQGENEKAKDLRYQCYVSEGKVNTYLKIYDDLVLGKTPKVPTGHPLSAVKWKKGTIKTESVPGKIIRTLQEGPCSRDDLIENVWGKNAIGPSYCSRLYTAINEIRKQKGIQIVFDGENYRLVG